MNIKEYVLRNPAIEHYIRAIVRLNMLKKRIENGTYKLRSLDSKKEIEGIDEKINANLELLKKYVANSYENVEYNELLEGINKLGNSISEKYDGTKSFKENFYNQLENMENDIETDIDKESKDSLLTDDKDDKEKDDSEKDDEEKDDEGMEIDETINTVDKLTINYSLKDDAFTCDAPDCETEIKKVPFKLYENNVEDQKRIYGDDYNFIFGEFDEKQLKYMDSRLVFLLWQKMGKEEAKNYLSEFVKGKDADKSKLNYEMVYDVNDIKNETELSKEEKKHLLKVIKHNQYVSENYKNKERNKLRIFSRIGAGFLALLAGIGIGAGIRNLKQETLKSGNERRISSSDLGDNENPENPDNPDKDDFSNRYKVDNQDLEIITDGGNGTKEDKIYEEAMKQFKIGNSLELGEGINYSEDSMGRGAKGETGVTPWRPAGTYEVNGISILNSNNEIVTYAIDKTGLSVQDYIKANMPEGGRVAFHIMQLKDGQKRATGWVESEAIYKAVVENYKQQQNAMER